jgi:hypothetical protein
MNLPQDPFLLNITRYLNRKNPYSNQNNQSNSNESSNRNNESGSNSSYSSKESHYYHYSSSYSSPSWFWWQQPQPTIINHNYNSIITTNKKHDSDDDDSKSNKDEGITATKVISGLILLGAVSGVGYIMINNYFDLTEEQDLYQKLKKSIYRNTSYNNLQFYHNLKVILKSNAGYSKRMFVTKMIGSVCGIAFLYNLFYVDNVQVMNGLYTLLGGTSLYGIYNFIKHQRLLASDEIKASYEIVHHFLNNPTIPSNPPPTAPVDPPSYPSLDPSQDPQEDQYSYMQTKQTS